MRLIVDPSTRSNLHCSVFRLFSINICNLQGFLIRAGWRSVWNLPLPHNRRDEKDHYDPAQACVRPAVLHGAERLDCLVQFFQAPQRHEPEPRRNALTFASLHRACPMGTCSLAFWAFFCGRLHDRSYNQAGSKYFLSGSSEPDRMLGAVLIRLRLPELCLRTGICR